MKIDDIIPYERNAREHKKSLPALIESIRRYGFRGKIQLRSREDPTIVNGHGRVEALKALGWTEIPDENIEFVGDLSDDEVRDYRLADNKTAELSTWNKALLRSEVRMSKFDMSKLGFDFKSKGLPYGAERLKTDRAYNLDIVNVFDCGKDGMPTLAAIDHAPDHLIGFNYAKTSADIGAGVHFFVDDYQFERCWNEPQRYLETLKGFDCVLTPDFSLYLDMPLPMQQWNVYRSRALGHWWQRNGLTVIPTISWAMPESYRFAFAGLERGGTYAVSTIGVKGDETSLRIWREGMEAAMRILKPRRILQYGGSIGFDFNGCEVVEYKNSVTERMSNGR